MPTGWARSLGLRKEDGPGSGGVGRCSKKKVTNLLAIYNTTAEKSLLTAARTDL
jgi:hypothetical protein